MKGFNANNLMFTLKSFKDKENTENIKNSI